MAVSWNVSDAESAIGDSDGCGPESVNADTTGAVFTCQATSAGGTATKSVTVKRDATPPTVAYGAASPAANAAGWHRSAVNVPFVAADVTSGVASTDPAASPLVIGTEGDAESGVVTAEDKAGIVNSVTSPVLRIDRTAPSVTITSPANGATFNQGQAVTAAYSCTDALSGMASCAGPVASGAALPTGQSGAASFAVDATDLAGNLQRVTHTYSVQAVTRVCSVDGDGDVDRDDIALITAARGKAASGPDDPRDPDRNNVINVLDARQCTLRCDRPSCAVN